MIRFEIDYLSIDIQFSVDSSDRDIDGLYEVQPSEALGKEYAATAKDLFMLEFREGYGLETQIGKDSDTPDDVKARLHMMKTNGQIVDFRVTEGAEIVEGVRTNNDADLVGPEGGFDLGPVPSWITEVLNG